MIITSHGRLIEASQVNHLYTINIMATNNFCYFIPLQSECIHYYYEYNTRVRVIGKQTNEQHTFHTQSTWSCLIQSHTLCNVQGAKTKTQLR